MKIMDIVLVSILMIASVIGIFVNAILFFIEIKEKNNFQEKTIKVSTTLADKINNARYAESYSKESSKLLENNKAIISVPNTNKDRITIFDCTENIFPQKIKGKSKKIEIKNLHISSENTIRTKKVIIKADEVNIKFFN